MRDCRLLVTLVAGWPALGCTEVDLEPISEGRPFLDNKLTIFGDLCTASPDTRIFPLRVLFVVDSSRSMEDNDPPDPVSGETGRERAVRETAATRATEVLANTGLLPLSGQRLEPGAGVRGRGLLRRPRGVCRIPRGLRHGPV